MADTRYEVSWYPSSSVDEWLSKHPDEDNRCEAAIHCEHCEHFDSYQSAIRFAESKIAEDEYGEVRVQKQELKLINCHDGGTLYKVWQDMGETEIVA